MLVHFEKTPIFAKNNFINPKKNKNMKKIIFALCMVMGLFMVSCQNGADMKTIVENAKKSGALASKICGAGGGGCLITLCNPKDRENVIIALKEAGAEILNFKLANCGVKIL